MSFFVSILDTLTLIEGKILASSQASRELSTASFTAVINDLTGESKPRKCLFFSKNSEIATCFWLDASFCAMPDIFVTPSLVLLGPNDLGPATRNFDYRRYIITNMEIISKLSVIAPFQLHVQDYPLLVFLLQLEI